MCTPQRPTAGPKEVEASSFAELRIFKFYQSIHETVLDVKYEQVWQKHACDNKSRLKNSKNVDIEKYVYSDKCISNQN